MFAGLIFTFGGFVFLLLLMVVYYSKQKFNALHNKLYRYILFISMLLIVSEIITSFYFQYGSNYNIFEVLLKIHWSTGIFLFSFMYFYCICVLKNINYKSLYQLVKNNNNCLFIFIYSVMAFIAYLFLPFTKMNYENFSYYPGFAAYFVVGYCILTVALIVIYMITKANDADKRKKMAIITTFFGAAIIYSIQIFFTKVSILGLGTSIQAFFLYFFIENPDLILMSKLTESREIIEKSNRAKSDFLSNMSHEIRTPMNAIVGFSNTLLNDTHFDKEKAINDIEHIKAAGNNLLDIINNILDISKIESSTDKLDEKEYSISSVIMELTSLIEVRLADRPIKLVIEVDPKTPSKVFGDQIKLFQILLNILGNAVKYTEVGRIKLTVTSQINRNTVRLRFRISDTGYGIKKEDYDKLFEKFSRLDSATGNDIEGTGLGLVITKKYVDLMNGKIWFESEYGAGTIFYVEVDQSIVDASPVGNVIEVVNQKEKIDYLDCSKYTVMVVDNNKLNLKVAQRILEQYKFNIELVSTSKECIYRVKEGKKYDMIFLDHMLPDMDGIEVVHILKKLVDYDIPPIVALTANAITGMREMYLREGFDEYLAKPINLSELNKIVCKYFKK